MIDGSGNRYDAWCQQVDVWWSEGCNGKYKDWFHDSCPKTCGLCVEEGILYMKYDFCICNQTFLSISIVLFWLKTSLQFILEYTTEQPTTVPTTGKQL